MRNGLLARLLPAMIMSFLVQSAHAGSPSAVAAPYGRPQRLVEVEGGRRLNLVCMGHGKPVVIFLSGLGSGSIDWRKVQPSIGQVTEACSYDLPAMVSATPPPGLPTQHTPSPTCMR